MQNHLLVVKLTPHDHNEKIQIQSLQNDNNNRINTTARKTFFRLDCVLEVLVGSTRLT